MIHLIQKENITKILVENDCNDAQVKEIVTLIKSNDKLEISLVGTKSIPAALIKAFCHYESKLTLSTDDKSLWVYLRKFFINISLNYIEKETSSIDTPIKAIGIGGSAGSLKNIIKILKKLPYADISVFVVMHILPDKKNALTSILQQCTSYTVKEAKHGEKIKQNHVYVASANFHMVVQNGFIYQTQTPKVNFCRPSIDVLFKTLALEYKDSLLAILTCGYMDDGSRSLSYIKENGGKSLIQDPNECEANEIPLNAIITQNHTDVLKIENISKYISAKLNTAVSLEENINILIDNINTTYGYDYSHYDKHSVIRRVEILRQELGIKNFQEFCNLIIKNRSMFELLFKKLSINVSEFFRNPEVFKDIRKEILPILKTYPHIRIWCSACSDGQEPYSVAMMLDEEGLLEKSIIYATDFNGTILQEAQNGLYSKKIYKKSLNNYTQSGGKQNFSKWWHITDKYAEITPAIKNKVQFFQHNLVTDAEINEFHLIFCRNVLIYFDENLQAKVFNLLHYSLIRDCFLVLGESESVSSELGFEKINPLTTHKIYKKIKEEQCDLIY